MKLEIFSVYDSKAKAFLPPFFLPMVGQATRIFQNCANDKTHQFGANPADYTLFHLGDFDDEKAIIETKPTPENLGIAQEFKNAEKIPDPDFKIAEVK
jgi:hypothetical protein